MTFFDFRPDDNASVANSLWIYFAVSVPLTLVIMIAWLLFTRKTRQKIANLMRRGPSEPKSRKDSDIKEV